MEAFIQGMQKEEYLLLNFSNLNKFILITISRQLLESHLDNRIWISMKHEIFRKYCKRIIKLGSYCLTFKYYRKHILHIQQRTISLVMAVASLCIYTKYDTYSYSGYMELSNEELAWMSQKQWSSHIWPLRTLSILNCSMLAVPPKNQAKCV